MWAYEVSATKDHYLHSNGEFKLRRERKTLVRTQWLINGWQGSNISHFLESAMISKQNCLLKERLFKLNICRL